jgi:hypothetical protein
MKRQLENKEERAARLRAQTQARLQERMRALGVPSYFGAGSGGALGADPAEERLEAERKEGEERAKKAERGAEEREEVRRARLGEAEGGGARRAAPASPAQKTVPPAPIRRGGPPTPKPPAPPIIARKTAKPPAPPAPTPQAPAPPAAPAFEDEWDEELKRREKALRERRERFEALRREEEEAQRAEAEYEARRAAGRTPVSPLLPGSAQGMNNHGLPPPIHSRGSAMKQSEHETEGTAGRTSVPATPIPAQDTNNRAPPPPISDEDWEVPAPSWVEQQGGGSSCEWFLMHNKTKKTDLQIDLELRGTIDQLEGRVERLEQLLHEMLTAICK